MIDNGTPKNRVCEELRTDRRWLVCLAVFAVLATLVLKLAEPPSPFCWWVSRHIFAGLVLLAGAAWAQLVTVFLRDVAAGASNLTALLSPENRWPQRFLGVVEFLGYSVAFATATRGEAMTGVGAWIALKQFGDWPRWKASAGPETQSVEKMADADEGRRRWYVFLFANALQVGLALVVARAVAWALAHPEGL
jgi:hypothetical protein